MWRYRTTWHLDLRLFFSYSTQLMSSAVPKSGDAVLVEGGSMFLSDT